MIDMYTINMAFIRLPGPLGLGDFPHLVHSARPEVANLHPGQ